MSLIIDNIQSASVLSGHTIFQRFTKKVKVISKKKFTVKKRSLTVAFLLGQVVFATIAPYAVHADAGKPKVSRGLHDEISGGVVAGQTITLNGQDFYRNFVTLWLDRDLSNRHSISIHERPSARSGSQIWIQQGQRRVLQISLPPARGNIRAISEQAVETVYQSVLDAEIQQAMFHDQDLAPDEM